MSGVTARCPACGYEQAAEFARCPVCGSESVGWWCVPCAEWRDSRSCAGCRGGLVVPAEVHVGAFPPGASVPFRFTIRNPGKKQLPFTAAADDPAVSLPARAGSVRAGGTTEIIGSVALGEVALGRRTFRVSIESAVAAETLLVVDVVAPVYRLEFDPPQVLIRNLAPGQAARRVLTLRNTGNVPLVATLQPSESWVSVSPVRVELAPGWSTAVSLRATTRKTEQGLRSARVRVVSRSGHEWELPVRVQLPEPELEALPVELGTVRAGRPVLGTLSLRNVGTVRAAVTLAADQPWLAVKAKKVTLPPGGERTLKLRAVLPAELEGPREARVVVSAGRRKLLSIPVTAVCHVPRPVLAAVRRPAVGRVANDAPTVRRFRLVNTGDGPMVCTVAADAPWVEVLTPELRVGAGKKRRVELRLDTPRMPAGLNTATVRVRSDGGDADVPLAVRVVEPRPELEILGDAELGTVAPDGAAAGTIQVRNVGVGLLALRAVPEDARVMVMPAETTVAPGPPKPLAVAVDVEGLGGGEHTFAVGLTSNGGDGVAMVRFRLPVELLDVPAEIDLGDRPAGRPVSEVVRVRNTGPDPVTLRVRAEGVSLRPGTERVTVQSGGLAAVPFTVDLPAGVFGPVQAVIRLLARTVRHAVAVRVVARRVELAASTKLLALGDMTPGEVRTVEVTVSNRGELAADVREAHVSGELEVWVRRQRLEPGETAAVSARVRMNAKGVGKKVRAVLPLADELAVRLTATVARPVLPRVVAAVVGLGGVAASATLGLTVGWFFGAAVALAGVVAAIVFLRLGDGR